MTDATPAPPTGEPVARIAAIEAIIAGRESARYWDNPALQREYRDLLAARPAPVPGDDAAGATTDAPDAGRAGAGPDSGAAPLTPAPVDEVRRTIAEAAAGAALIESWEQRGGAAAHIARLRGAAESVLRLTADPAALIAGFDALPDPARMAVFAELANGAPGYATPAVPDAMARFASTPEGAALRKDWGSAASRRIGAFNARAWRVLDRLSEDDVDAMVRWFNDLDGRTTQALVAALTQ